MMIYKFATGSEDKLREARSVLGEQLQSVKVDLLEVQSEDISEVAAHKAKEGFEKIGEPVLVEDTGLYLEGLNGMPGPFIKWFLKADGIPGLLRMISGKSLVAKAVTVAAIYNGTEVITGVGEIEGSIANEARGPNGFGWDKIFMPNGSSKTFGEMDLDEKNLYSMRRKAFENIIAKLESPK